MSLYENCKFLKIEKTSQKGEEFLSIRKTTIKKTESKKRTYLVSFLERTCFAINMIDKASIVNWVYPSANESSP
jgi:hypothetical protein